MKALTACLILFYVHSSFAKNNNKKIKLNDATWKSNLSIQVQLSDEEPVRVPSQNAKEKKKEVKPEKWKYLGPDQIELDSLDPTN